MRHLVEEQVPEYQKGDDQSTAEIAGHYKTAIVNGQKTLPPLQGEGLPTLEDTDDKNLVVS